MPITGDFHYIGHKLLTDHPAAAEALAKYRINPGNVGFKAKRDTQFSTLIELALRWNKPVRIGVNWGSLDEELLTRLMDENAGSLAPISAAAVQREAIIQSALLSAQRAEEIGLPRNRIILSTKVSDVQNLIAVYQDLAARCDHALHLGLTEAGMGTKGIVAFSWFLDSQSKATLNHKARAMYISPAPRQPSRPAIVRLWTCAQRGARPTN